MLNYNLNSTSFSVIKLVKQDLYVAISKFKDKLQEVYQN